MTEAGCLGGCKVRDMHFAACESFGVAGAGSCRGCVPVAAAEDSLLCGRCYSRLRSMLIATPDLVAQIRTLAHPLKAMDYAKEPGSGGGGRTPPPPVPVDLLDSGDEIMTILLSAVIVVRGGEPVGRFVIQPGTEAPAAYRHALEAVQTLLEALPYLARRPEIEPFTAAVLGQPADPDGWTIAKAMRRYSLADEPWWAAQPCLMPLCRLRSVKVTPPKCEADDTKYECSSCGWEALPEDLDICAVAFSKREGKAA